MTELDIQQAARAIVVDYENCHQDATNKATAAILELVRAGQVAELKRAKIQGYIAGSKVVFVDRRIAALSAEARGGEVSDGDK